MAVILPRLNLKSKLYTPAIAILLAMGLIWQFTDFGLILSNLSKISFWNACASLAAVLTANLVGSYRFVILSNLFGARVHTQQLNYIYWTGNAYSQVLPTSVGGDLIRLYWMKKSKVSLNLSMLIIFVERFFGLIGLIFVTLISLAAVFYIFPNYINFLVSKIEGIVTIDHIFFYFFIFFAVGLMSLMFVLSDLRKKIAKVFRRSLGAIKTRNIVIMIILSAIIHTFYLFALFIIGLPFGLNNALMVILLVPLAEVMAVLPISVAGWGVREVSYLSIGVLLGLEHEVLLILSISYGVMILIGALPGFYHSLLLGMQREKTNE